MLEPGRSGDAGSTGTAARNELAEYVARPSTFAPGRAAFGRVVEGMDLVRQIQRLPVEGELLRRPIPFTASRVK